MKNYLNKQELIKDQYLENLERAISETDGEYRERLLWIKQVYISSNRVFDQDDILV